MPGLITAVAPGSVAEAAGLRAGDALSHINGRALRDVIDAQFFAAEDAVRFEGERDGVALALATPRAHGQELGITFEHPTFDIDIRRCNNLCPFCFVLQNAPRMRRTLYIKDDDYRYSFLFGHYVTLTNLNEEDWARLAEQRLSPLYVSVHSTDLAVRRVCLRNDKAPDVMQQLRWLADHGIETHTQLVITPGMNDGDLMERSVRELASLHPHVQTATVVPVGLTRHHKYGHRAHTPAECAAVVDTVNRWQAEFARTLGTRFVFATDEWYLVGKRPLPKKRDYEGHRLQENGLGMVRDFENEWRRVRKSELGSRDAVGLNKVDIHHASFTHVILATGTLFAPTLRKAAREFSAHTGLRTDVVGVVNEKLGDTITVAGLLMGEDVVRQVKAAREVWQSAPGDQGSSPILVLPRIMFDHPDGVALDDVSPRKIAAALNMPVALADWMGDVVDAVTGKNKLVFHPGEDLTVPVMREGGWAVEKYL